MEKVFQLYEMIRVRHGLMLVGKENTGKTSVYRVLAQAITKMATNYPTMGEFEV
jgi:dynein heavy chain